MHSHDGTGPADESDLRFELFVPERPWRGCLRRYDLIHDISERLGKLFRKSRCFSIRLHTRWTTYRFNLKYWIVIKCSGRRQYAAYVTRQIIRGIRSQSWSSL